MRRVVVTGMGAVTPIGIGVENFWNSVKEKRTGFDKITKFDTTGFKASLAAEIKDFDPKEFMDFKAARRMELFCQYAVAAAAEAMKNAGIDMEKEDPYRVGCYVGSGIGSLQAMEREHKRLLERGASRINPLLVPLMISNMACGNVSIQLGLKGKSLNVVTACATGTHSIGEAFRSIQIGDADVIVAGGTEAAICPMGVGGFSALTALSSATDPKRCSIPFDKDRSGFVIRICLDIPDKEVPEVLYDGGRCRCCYFRRTFSCTGKKRQYSGGSGRLWLYQRCLPYHITGGRR